jgi:hypothetical protein
MVIFQFTIYLSYQKFTNYNYYQFNHYLYIYVHTYIYICIYIYNVYLWLCKRGRGWFMSTLDESTLVNEWGPPRIVRSSATKMVSPNYNRPGVNFHPGLTFTRSRTRGAGEQSGIVAHRPLPHPSPWPATYCERPTKLLGASCARGQPLPSVNFA